jgi:hypothetical protein
LAIGEGDDGPRHDPVEQIGLPRLERDQPPEHIEQVQQVLGIFGEPAFGLNLFERRGRPRDILTGFLAPDERASCGRPVGVTIGPDGSLLVADDVGDVIWRVTGERRG